jgi:hypothetical protein
MADRSPKLRGGRRYFQKLQRWPDSVTILLGGDNWYDLWHTHPDFPGWSRRGHGARRAHLAVLFAAFHRLLEQLAERAESAQVFVTVNTHDSPGDALYVHTPNPHGKFPYDFGSCRWEGFRVPGWLAEFVDANRFEVAERVFEGEKRYVVTPRGRRGRPATA